MKPYNFNFTEAELSDMNIVFERFAELYKRFEKDTESDNIIQLILRGHLYIEHELKQSLKKHLKYPELLGDRLRFVDIMNFVFALGAMPQQYLNSLRVINNIRNKLAHNLNYEFNNEDLENLENSLAPDILESYKYNTNDKRTDRDKLRTILFWVWESLVSENIIPDNIKERLVEIREFVRKFKEGVDIL